MSKILCLELNGLNYLCKDLTRYNADNIFYFFMQGGTYGSCWDHIFVFEGSQFNLKTFAQNDSMNMTSWN